MRLLIAALALLALVYATKKADFLTKLVNVGLKIPTKPQLNQLCTCMETPIYQERSIDNLTATGTNCGMDVMMSSLSDLITIYNNMESCLGACPTEPSTISLATNWAMSQSGSALPLFSQLITNIKTCKANKKPKATCIENMYGFGSKLFNKTVINQYCTKFVQSGAVDPCEWKCITSVGKKVVDFSQYKCATMTPPSKSR